MSRATLCVLLAACSKDHTEVRPGSATSASDPWASKPGVGSSNAADDPASPAAAHRLALEVCPKVTRPIYFTIEKHGKVSHALGTRHFGVGVDRFPAAIADELRHAKVAVFEVAPDDGASPDDPPADLPAELGQPAWQHLRELVGGERASQLEHSGAMFAALTVPSIFEDLSDQLDDELGKIATDAKIPARGLESGKFQFQLLHEVFTPEVARGLVLSIKNRDEIRDDTARELAAYCKGDPGDGGFDAQTRRYFKGAGLDDARIASIEDRMVFQRTAAWVPELEPMLADGGVFIAVGADHLVGPHGLAALLGKAGYKVTAVAPASPGREPRTSNPYPPPQAEAP